MSKARDLANAADVLDDVSATELSYVNGVTSAIQTQLNNKQAVVANVNDTEIGYLDGVTSAIQTQLDAKVAKSLVDAKGDLLVGSANDTVSRLAVGSNDQVLTADSTTATGLKWASPTSAATDFTLLNAGGTALTGAATITVSSLSGYNYLYVLAVGASSASASSQISLRLNSDSTANAYVFNAMYNDASGANNEPGWDYGSQTSFALATIGDSAANVCQLSMMISGANATGYKPVSYSAYGSGTGLSRIANGHYVGTSVISSVSIISGTGNFDAGTIYIYGAN